LRSVYLNDTMSVASFATFVAVWLAITIFCLAWMVAYVKKSVKAGGPTGNAGGANGGTAAVKGGFFQRYWDYFSNLKGAVFSTEDKRLPQQHQQSTSPPQQQQSAGAAAPSAAPAAPSANPAAGAAAPSAAPADPSFSSIS